MTSAMTPIGVDVRGCVLGSWTPPCRTPPLPHELYTTPPEYGEAEQEEEAEEEADGGGGRLLLPALSHHSTELRLSHRALSQAATAAGSRGGSSVSGSGGVGGKQCSCEADHYVDGYSELYRPVAGILRYAGDACNIMPDEQRRFLAYKVECIIKDLLEIKLKNARYDPATCNQLAHDLCAMIKERTKDLRFDRYKLVTQVLIGEDTDQSVQIASRCLWNQDTDNFAAATFRNSSMYAVAIVYGLYLE